MVLLVAGMRIGTLLQLAPSAMRAVEVSPAPALAVASLAVAAATSTVVSVTVLRRGTCLGPKATAADLALSMALLLLGPLTVPVDDRIGTWIGFQPGYALSVLIAATGVRSAMVWGLGLVGTVVALVAFVGSALDQESSVTVAGNVLTFITVASIARGSVSYIRRVARDADTARDRAAELGRREEERRAQVAIHNGATVMSLLGNPDIDPLVRTRLEAQARHEAQRLRTYLRGAPPKHDDDPTLLAVVVSEVASSFPELPIELALDLGSDVELPGSQVEVVSAALTSILLNVRLHARAQQVVIHLDRDEREWTLVIHDDGVGFDRERVPFGVGLRELVVGEPGRHGIPVAVHSRPGEGATVTLSSAMRDWEVAEPS